MTISNQDVIVLYDGDGVETDFSITPDILTNDEIVVKLRPTEGADVTQEESTHFDFTGGNVLLGVPATGISFLTAPASGYKIVILRDNTISQGYQFLGTGIFNPANIEKALDKNIRIIQEMNYRVRGALKFRQTSPDFIDYDIPDPTDGSALVWTDAAGFEWLPVIEAVGDISAALLVERSVARTLTNVTLVGPAGLVKADVGLANVDNVSDVNKPVSTAQATADALKLAKASNLSDLTSVATALTNLGLASEAVRGGIYRTLHQASGSITAAQTTGNYLVPNGEVLIKDGVGSLAPPAMIVLDDDHFPDILGLTPKFRIELIVNCNNVAPTGAFYLQLHRISRPGSSGGAGLCIYTLNGTELETDSKTGTVTTPAADSQTSVFSADFDIDLFNYSDFYAFVLTYSGTIAASAHVHVNAKLKVRWV